MYIYISFYFFSSFSFFQREFIQISYSSDSTSSFFSMEIILHSFLCDPSFLTHNYFRQI